MIKEFVAKNSADLGLCLKLLYSEHMDFSVEVRETEKLKVIYVVKIMADIETCEDLEVRYRILVS